MSQAGDRGGRKPTRDYQSDYIVDNAFTLDSKAKKAILDLVMMEVIRPDSEAEEGADSDSGQAFDDVVLLCNQKGVEIVDGIQLDNINNPKVIEHIYNIVRNRRESLDEVPA